MKDTVLLTGARAPVAVDLARSFRAAGCDVHLADSVTPWAARCLRPRVPIHRLASPRFSFPSFRRGLDALVRRLDPGVIVPTCEEVFWVTEAATLDGYADRVFAPAPELLRRLHSKADFGKLAASCGVSVPDSWVVTSPDEMTQVPLAPAERVLKPEFSRFSTQTLIRPGDEAVRRVVPSLGHRWVVQRFLEGTEVCSWAAVRGGIVVAFAAYRPVWRHGRAAIAFESVDWPGVADVSRRIAAATGMTGHLSLDMIVTPDGAVLPIECNPRAVSGVHLWDADPAMARAFLGEGTAPVPAPGRLRYLGPAMAVFGLPNALLSGRVRDFGQDMRRGSDVMGRVGDRLPVVGAFADALRFATVGLANGRSTAEQATADIEWNGEAMT